MFELFLVSRCCWELVVWDWIFGLVLFGGRVFDMVGFCLRNLVLYWVCIWWFLVIDGLGGLDWVVMGLVGLWNWMLMLYCWWYWYVRVLSWELVFWNVCWLIVVVMCGWIDYGLLVCCDCKVKWWSRVCESLSWWVYVFCWSCWFCWC